MTFITLTNRQGLRARFCNYGARWVGMFTPDRDGRFDDILLGFDTLSAYRKAGEPYHGALVGRVCGRIGNASFRMEGKTYPLTSNDLYGRPVRNHLHGGIDAFHRRMWEIRSVDPAGNRVTFSLFSPDGEEGYPGNLSVEVTYTLTDENKLRMECAARTDRMTPVNLTNHSFFNLRGSRDVLDQELQIFSTRLIECDEELLPTGKLIPVKNTFYDFTSSKKIRESLPGAAENKGAGKGAVENRGTEEGTAENKITGNEAAENSPKGFSIAFALDKKESERSIAAILKDDRSGRKMEIYTDQPSLQVYTGYLMDGSDVGKKNRRYFASAGIALEPQGFPDAPNHSEFPTVFISPDRPYKQITEYVFGWI